MSSATLSPSVSTNYKSYVVVGLTTAFTIFGGLGTWASVAQLDSAVISQGSVVVETARKIVQHLEGGILEAVLVEEGQLVTAGQVLARLRPVQAEATLDTHTADLYGALALEARLIAERDRQTKISWPGELDEHRHESLVRRLLDDQTNQFIERRMLNDAEAGVLGSRSEQLKRQLKGLAATLNATRRQDVSLHAEYNRVKELFKQGYFPLNRMAEMERRLAESEGRIGQIQADIAKTEEMVSETALQILQTRQKFRDDVTKSLRDARLQVAELKEKIRISRDILVRQDIQAPISGRVQSLRFHNRGAVVKPGDVVLEIVPLDEGLTVYAHVQPLDINHIQVGQVAEVRFPGVKSRTTPMVVGTVRNVSSDVMRDDAQKEPYYLAMVDVKPSDLPPMLKGRLTAGMPTDVLINTGERTVASYLISPLVDAARKTMREP